MSGSLTSGTLVLNEGAIPGSVIQEAIQFQEEGVNLGGPGAADTVNFAGAAITAALVGSTLTVTVVDTTGQPDIQFKDEGVNLGVPGAVNSINFTGGAITASLVGSALTVSVPTAGAQAPIQYQEEGVNLGAAGAATTVNYVGGATTAALVGSTLTVTTAAQGPVQYQEEGINLGAAGAATTINFVGAPTTAALVGSTLTVTTAAQTPIQYQEEGVNLGAAGAAVTVNFTGAGSTASIVGSTVTVDSPLQTITLTSDVTGSGTGSFATTIANDAVTNAKLANMATQTIKGRTTAGTGDPEDLTPAQVRAMLGSQSIIVAASDEVTALTTGTAKITFRMPYAFTVTAVRASLTTAQASGSIFTVDINESGTSILSTKLTIDNTETTSTTAATPPVISDSSLADDAEMTVDIDQIGNGTAKGLKVVLIGYAT